MSFDLNLSKDGDTKADFSIGYNKWGLLETIFHTGTIWFKTIDEKNGRDSIPMIEEAIKELNKLPKSGTTGEDRVYNETIYNSLITQLEYMLLESQKNKEYNWSISL